MNTFRDYLLAESEMEKLKTARVNLSDEERNEVINAKAVWHHNGNKPTPAVWKSVDKKGNVTYVTNTHRAYQTAKSLKGAIGKYHSFIKGTA